MTVKTHKQHGGVFPICIFLWGIPHRVNGVTAVFFVVCKKQQRKRWWRQTCRFLGKTFCWDTYLTFLGGGNSNIWYVHPYLGKMDPIWWVTSFFFSILEKNRRHTKSRKICVLRFSMKFLFPLGCKQQVPSETNVVFFQGQHGLQRQAAGRILSLGFPRFFVSVFVFGVFLVEKIQELAGYFSGHGTFKSLFYSTFEWHFS